MTSLDKVRRQQLSTYGRDLPAFVSFPLLIYLPALKTDLHIRRLDAWNEQKVSSKNNIRFQPDLQRITTRTTRSFRKRVSTSWIWNKAGKSSKWGLQGVPHWLATTCPISWLACEITLQECMKCTAAFHQVDKLQLARGIFVCTNIYLQRSSSKIQQAQYFRWLPQLLMDTLSLKHGKKNGMLSPSWSPAEQSSQHQPMWDASFRHWLNTCLWTNHGLSLTLTAETSLALVLVWS